VAIGFSSIDLDPTNPTKQQQTSLLATYKDSILIEELRSIFSLAFCKYGNKYETIFTRGKGLEAGYCGGCRGTHQTFAGA